VADESRPPLEHEAAARERKQLARSARCSRDRSTAPQSCSSVESALTADEKSSMTREARAALAAVMVAQSVLGAQDTTKKVTPASAVRVSAPTLESLVAEESQRRANIARVLILTNPTTAQQQQDLKKLNDQLYVDQRVVQGTREQLQAATEAMRKQSNTTLVVTFASDPANTSRVSGVALAVDGARTSSLAFTDSSSASLRAGAAEEMFRGTVLPTSHEIALTAIVNGQPQQQMLRVKVTPGAVTYVQFGLLDGKLVRTAWAGVGTNPF
jgi:uncharacterized coiled-coil protein SlyX